MGERGFIHIYCGDGKGKTTAATGLMIRAAGRGKRCLFVRFLKNEDSGELKILDQIPEIDRLPMRDPNGFFWNLGEKEKEDLRRAYCEAWEQIEKRVQSGRYDILVLDEVMAAYGHDLICKDAVIRFLTEKPEGLEVIMTGRNPDERLLALADYISEIHAVKHPYEQGIPAREGIEY